MTTLLNIDYTITLERIINNFMILANKNLGEIMIYSVDKMKKLHTI